MMPDDQVKYREGISEVGLGDGSEAFLTGHVPDLESDLLPAVRTV
jgi:hypothetical protein